MSPFTVSEPEYALTKSAQKIKQSDSNYARGKIFSPKKKKFSFPNFECFESRDSGGSMDPNEVQGEEPSGFVLRHLNGRRTLTEKKRRKTDVRCGTDDGSEGVVYGSGWERLSNFEEENKAAQGFR
jgi:hypothetical protein